ncbi:MAG TPA: HAMP domain-containing sensor histidine kinase [Mucilaginibacter sp.]
MTREHKTISSKINALIEKLTGSVEDFSMEARIFHATCLVSLAGISCNIPLNYFIGVPALAWLMTALLVVVCFIYYYSRFRGKLNAGLFFYCLVSNVFFTINFEQNSGINGPSLLIFLLSMFLVIAIAPKIQFWFWIPANIVLVSVLLVMEYKHPESVANTYPAAIDRYIDFGYSYLVIAILIASVTLYIRDSYNRQRLALMKKAEELENTNITKNKLFSVIAHDLRAPLGSIQGYLELLTTYKLSEDEKRGMERDLLEKTKNTGEMLSNLLSWTMNQMEGVSVNLEQVNLNTLLKPVLQMQRSIAKEKLIELKTNIDNDAWVIADANMLQLVLRNLLSNAIKFTPPGGEITVASEANGSDWHILVKDSGVGISDKYKESIFSLKMKSTYGTQNEKGAGLGLILCKEFTELQGGDIWFESAAGSGTTFYIRLKGCHFPGKNIKSAGHAVHLLRKDDQAAGKNHFVTTFKSF